MRNGGLIDVVAATIDAGSTPAAARKWWTGEITRVANAQERDVADLVSPQNVAALQQLVDAGTLTDKLARQVLEGVIAGEGTPQEVVDARGLAVVSDDGALIAAIDDAFAAQPDVLAKIKDGKVQAAGAVIGAVMKAMKGTGRRRTRARADPGTGRARLTVMSHASTRMEAWDAVTDRDDWSRPKGRTTAAPASCMSTWMRSTPLSKCCTILRCAGCP